MRLNMNLDTTNEVCQIEVHVRNFKTFFNMRSFLFFDILWHKSFLKVLLETYEQICFDYIYLEFLCFERICIFQIEKKIFDDFSLIFRKKVIFISFCLMYVAIWILIWKKFQEFSCICFSKKYSVISFRDNQLTHFKHLAHLISSSLHLKQYYI